jgi:cytochrome c oxidase cbb3-type subunit III
MSARGWWMSIGLAAAFACKGDSPPVVTGSPPGPLGSELVRTSELIAGPLKTDPQIRNPYEGQKNTLAEGRRYYNWFNCTGCHGGAGGGGIGPPLADDDWIYGGEPAQIFLSIVQGRPYGMPSFGGQIPDAQVWMIVSYINSLAGEEGPEGATADESGGEESGGERGSREVGEGGADR